MASYDLRQDGFLRATNPDREIMIKGLSWVTDGISNPEKGSVSELDAVQGLVYLAVNGGEAFNFVMEQPWVREGSNKPAMQSLGHLARQYPEELARIMTIPNVRDGLDDHEAKILATLWIVHRYDPPLVDTLLNPEKTNLERRTIDLPLAGEVHLTLIRTRPGAERSIDVIENAVRGIEEFMSAPFPQRDLIILFEEALPDFAGGLNSKTHTTIRPHRDEDDAAADAAFALHVHELASYYWTGNEQWIVQGAEVLLDSFAGKDTVDYSFAMGRGPCAYARGIAHLETLAYAKGSPGFFCNYSLGERIFKSLYWHLPESAFHQGFLNLYLLAQHDDEDDHCEGISAGICHLESAFKSGAPQETAAAVDEVIARLYHATEPPDLSHQDNRPIDPTLPNINGRVDRAWVSTERYSGPSVGSISAADPPERLYINLMYSHEYHSGPDRLTLQSVQYFEGDGFYFNSDDNDSINVTGSRSLRRAGFSLGRQSVSGPPGRYWVYVYLGDRKVAEVAYDIEP